MSQAEAAGAGEFPAIEELIPHRGPVVLLDRILRHDSTSTDAQVSVADQRWLKRDDGSVASWLAVEYMAQCVAAHEGLIALEEGRPPPSGFLVGVTGLRLEAFEFASDARLRVSSRRVRGRPALGALSHQCRLALEDFGEENSGANPNGEATGRLLAEGRFIVSVRPDAAD